MSTDIVSFNGGQLPAYLQGHHGVTDALARGSASGNRISIRGRVWRLVQDGQEIQQNPNPTLDLVIIAASPQCGRTYYMSEYSSDSADPPDCWSNDGVTPDTNSTYPQSHACATCPQNQPGSGKRNDSRACRFSQRIAVAIPGMMDRAYSMQLPATSLFGDATQGNTPKPLTSYGKYLRSMNVDASVLVTTFSFDLNETQPVVRFNANRYLTEQEYAQVCTLLRDPETTAMLPMSFAKKAGAAPQAVPQQMQQPVPYEQMVQQPAPVVQQPAYVAPVQQAPVQQVPVQQAAPVASFGAPPQQQMPPASFGVPQQQQVPQAGFGAPQQQQVPQAGFGAPVVQDVPPQAGFGAPPPAEAPAKTKSRTKRTPVESDVAPQVVTTQTAAAQTGMPEGNVADLLRNWGVGGPAQ